MWKKRKRAALAGFLLAGTLSGFGLLFLGAEDRPCVFTFGMMVFALVMWVSSDGALEGVLREIEMAQFWREVEERMRDRA